MESCLATTRSGGVCHVHAMTCRAHGTCIGETVFVPDTAWRGMRSCSSGVLYKHEQRTQRAVTLAVTNSHLPRKFYICLSPSSRRGHRAIVGVRVLGRAATSSSNIRCAVVALQNRGPSGALRSRLRSGCHGAEPHWLRARRSLATESRLAVSLCLILLTVAK